MILVICTILSCVPAVFAANEPAPSINTVTLDLSQYIVFDLAKGSVTITASSYSGYMYVLNTDGTGYTLTNKTVSERTGNEKFYVFQSSCKFTDEGAVPTSVTGNTLVLKSYDIDNAFLEGNKDIPGVISTWNEKAVGPDSANPYRASTSNKILVKNGNHSCDLTVDDIWSTYQRYSSSYSTDSGNGGINVDVKSTDLKVTLRLRGDNRLAYFYYCCNNDGSNTLSTTKGLTVCDDVSADGIGSLTVIGDTTPTYSNNNYKTLVTGNHWNSVFGGTDSQADADNMSFESGVVYAGALETENCTAIGAGGNGFGGIYVSGGSVTAVSNSTGTAIGGGIAHTGTGGYSYVNITGGNVYAYNFGIAAFDQVSNYGNVTSEQKAAAKHIPGTAIGGASSILQAGASQSTINISGGNVYAESRGGAGIGGGNSIVGAGGAAIVNISGGNVTAKSSTYNGFFADGTTPYTVQAGTGIGGGSSMQKTGGSATVTVSGGTVVSDGIGGGFSATHGYADGSVKVTGGSLNSGMSAIPVNESGETLYLTRLSFFNNETTMIGQPLLNLPGDQYSGLILKGNTPYITKDIRTDSVGMVYLWLPETEAVLSAKLSVTGETVNYTPNHEADSDVDAKDVGSLIYDTDLPRYTVNIAACDYYTLFFNDALTENFSGSVVIPQGTFSFYLTVKEGYTLIPYVGEIVDGNKVLTQGAPLQYVEGSLNGYGTSRYIDGDTDIWFMIENQETGDSSFAIDLTGGDVVITEIDGSMTITQNGYTISGYKGEIILTSAGCPTSHTLTVISEKGADGKYGTVNISANELNIIADKNAITVESGTLNMNFGEYNNMIHSVSGAPIYIEENGSFSLTTNEKDSIQFSSGATSVVLGAGTLSLSDLGGFLTMMAPDGTTQITVGTFEFQGTNKEYSSKLYKESEDYSYTVIGFIQNGVLYPLDVDPVSSSNTNFFAARGILEIYQGITATSKLVGQNLVMNFKTTDSSVDIGYIRIFDSAGNLIFDSKSYAARAVIGNTFEYSIDGSAFVDGNLTVYAAAKGLISYAVVPYSGEYDGKAHGITVELDTTLFYVTYLLNIDGVWVEQTSAPTFTDAGSYLVGVKVDGINPDDNYQTAYDYTKGKVTITQADNAWKVQISCQDVIKGGVPTPSASATWGTDQITYTYYDADGNVINDVSALEVGTYYVTATIAEHNNYKPLESDRIRFKVFITAVYAMDGKHLDKLDPSSATTSALVIRNNGAFSVYYETSSEAASSVLKLTAALPIGTSITMITFDDALNAEYYFRKIVEADVNTTANTTTVLLNSFTKMGDATSSYIAPSNGTSVKYQFCIEYENFNVVPFDIELNGAIKQQIQAPITHVAYFSELSGSDLAVSESANGEFNVSVKPTVAASSGNKLLAFRINAVTGSLSNVQVTLSESGTTAAPLTPIYACGDMYVFNIGGVNVTAINSVYTLNVSGVQTGTYTVTSHLRIVDVAEAPQYAFGSSTSKNTVSESVTVTTAAKLRLYVELASGSRVISAADANTLVFNVSASEAVSSLNVTVYKKNQYGSYQALTSQSAAVTNGKLTQVISANSLTPGTYRLAFELNGTVYNYNVIVTD